MIKNELLEAESLSINFNYPKEYLDFIKNPSILSNTPWWLIGTSTGFFKTCYEVTNYEQKSTKILIPFAKSDRSNILACFDQNHKIWLTSCERNDITGAEWNNRFYLENFSAWLDWVLLRCE